MLILVKASDVFFLFHHGIRTTGLYRFWVLYNFLYAGRGMFIAAVSGFCLDLASTYG